MTMTAPSEHWIYKYIRADGEEIDMGPYPSEGMARRRAQEHAKFGALTSKPEQVDDDYKLYTG